MTFLRVRLGTLLRDVRYAVRVLTRSPGFAIASVLTLAAGIGANGAAFSVIDAVLLRPLPFPHGERLVQVLQTQRDAETTPVAPARLEDWNDGRSALEGITGYYAQDVTVRNAEPPERVRGAFVAPRFFDVLGVGPALGRSFTADDHRAVGETPVVLSERYWRERFGADRTVLGKTLRVGSGSHPIVGVMPASFAFPDRDIAAWFPLPVVDTALVPGTNPRSYTWYTAVARLRPGATLQRARADLALVQARLAQRYPDTDRDIGVRAVPLKDTVVGDVRGSLWLVFGAVSALLLVACTNVAALMLARAARRRREVAIRFSLGASRAALVRQVLVEAAVLAVAGVALGVLLAAGALAALRRLAPDLPRLAEVRLDAPVLLYTLGAAVVAMLLAGLLPALRGTRGDGGLARGRGAEVSPRHALQWGLVGAQVAVSVALLAGAGLLLRSFEALSRVDPGFDPAHVLTFTISGNYGETADFDRLVQRIDNTLDALRALPGVDAAATAVFLPGVPGRFAQQFHLEGQRNVGETPMSAESRAVSRGYFETLRIPLLAGRLCRGTAKAPRSGDAEVMVNRRFAQLYLAGRSAVGLRLGGLDFAAGPGSARIAGVVGDARETGLDRPPVPVVYLCFSAGSPTPSFLLRTSGDPEALLPAVRAKIQALEPLRSVYATAPLERRIETAYAQNRARTVLVGMLAAAAFSLACLGVYGTLSYVASLRRREVALRVALGASAASVVAQFLLGVLRVVGGACFAGVMAALPFTRTLSDMLYGVSPSDPVTLVGVVALVLIVACLAALVPALRASRLEPMRVLRED